MGFWTKLLGKEELEKELQETFEPQICCEEIPHTLDLGWYYSENKDQFQMAKINEKDRSSHFYVIGATGSGKTKFLEFLIKQDIEKGNGFGVIDPHGDLIEDIKGILACHYNEKKDEKEIRERIVLIDPTDQNSTVTFNPLEKIPGIFPVDQANELLSAFRKIWQESWGVRMEDLLRNSLIALGEAGLTLTELPHFLTKRAYREVVLKDVKSSITNDYFKRFDSLTDRGQVTWVEPVMNKINAFLCDQRIRQIFSSTKSSFNLREIMDQGKILLVKLDKGKLKDGSDLLGSLIMSMIQMAAFGRSDIPQNKRTPFYLYIDEFQNFATESFFLVLSEARKYGLSLVMAHQSLSQIPVELKSLILGNTGVQVYFRVNRSDANLLAKEGFVYSGYEVKAVSYHRPIFWSYAEEWEHKIEELQNLPPRVCYVKHKIEGGIIPIETIKIDPPWEVLEMNEEEYNAFLKSLPFGKDYLVSREKIGLLEDQREKKIKEEIEKRIKETTPLSPQPVYIAGTKERKRSSVPIDVIEDDIKREVKEKEVPAFEESPSLGRGGAQHKYLQQLIKRVAQEKGYIAIIEKPILDGLGSVDVSLENNGNKIACEISVSTGGDQELSNIQKCIAAGYDRMILLSSDRKGLNRLKDFISVKLGKEKIENLSFFMPEEFIEYLDSIEAEQACKEEVVAGYKVKVNYRPIGEVEKKTKRQAVAQVILSALRRLKG